MKHLFTLILFGLSYLSAYSSTTISGVITTSTWTKANGPYYVTGSSKVLSNNTLTIEPGVSVYFSKDVSFSVRGFLYAVGTQQDSIYFKGLTNDMSLWSGINLENTFGGSLNLEYVVVTDSYSGVYVTCCSVPSPTLAISHSKFSNNYYGVSGYTGININISNSLFEYNIQGIATGEFSLNYCTVRYNETGISGESMEVKNSEFYGNSKVGMELIGGTFQSNKVHNNTIGVSISNASIDDFEIYNNNIGVILYGSNFMMTNSKICSNSVYNVKNSVNTDFSLSNVCWCTTSETEIANKIYDVYDDISLGEVTYKPFVNACNIITEIKEEVEHAENILVHYNHDTKMLSINATDQNADFSIVSIQGKTLQTGSFFRSVEIPFDTKGLFLIQTSTKNDAKRFKIIVE